MPCNHDAARNLLGIGWVHTVFLLIPGRSTHGHRQAQVRKERGEGAEEAGGGGESKVGKKQGRKTMQLGKCSPASRLRVKPFYKHKGESESKNCAAERSKMGLGGESSVDISTGNISTRRRRASLAKTILKGIRSECDCPFIAAQLFCVISGDTFTHGVSKRQSKKKKKEKRCARITHTRRDENGSHAEWNCAMNKDARFSWLTHWLTWWGTDCKSQ